MAKIDQSGKKLITQDRQLIHASYTLNINEKRLILLGLYRVKSDQMPNKDHPLDFIITAEEWKNAYPESKKDAYKHMERACKQLQKRVVRLKRDRDNIHAKTLSWVDKVEPIAGEGKIRLVFAKTITPYIQGMQGEFTVYEFGNMKRLGTLYAIRLYELLSSYSKTTCVLYITVDDLRFSLGTGHAYSSWGEFNRMVLVKALLEVNSKTDLAVTYKIIKKGRKVHSIEFNYLKKEQPDLFKQIR